jgi:hypothetical protein
MRFLEEKSSAATPPSLLGVEGGDKGKTIDFTQDGGHLVSLSLNLTVIK